MLPPPQWIKDVNLMGVFWLLEISQGQVISLIAEVPLSLLASWSVG